MDRFRDEVVEQHASDHVNPPNNHPVGVGAPFGVWVGAPAGISLATLTATVPR